MTTLLTLEIAILSFTAAFFLVRSRVKEASRQELKVEIKEAVHRSNGHSNGNPLDTSQAHDSSGLPEGVDVSQLSGAELDQLKEQVLNQPIFSADPRLEAVGPFRRGKPPTHLLESCHTLCMLLSVLGFIMAMVGVLCYGWAMLPRSSSRDYPMFLAT